MYEECCIVTQWPSLQIALGFANELDRGAFGPIQHFEPEHMEVLTCSLPASDFTDLDDVDGWISVFEKVKPYVFVALADPQMHLSGAYVVKKFWLSRNDRLAIASMDASTQTLVQTWLVLYGDLERAKVDNKEMFHFLKEIQNGGTRISELLENTVKDFKSMHPDEYEHSNLGDLFL